jgi:hypothetical protein
MEDIPTLPRKDNPTLHLTCAAPDVGGGAEGLASAKGGVSGEWSATAASHIIATSCLAVWL